MIQWYSQPGISWVNLLTRHWGSSPTERTLGSGGSDYVEAFRGTGINVSQVVGSLKGLHDIHNFSFCIRHLMVCLEWDTCSVGSLNFEECDLRTSNGRVTWTKTLFLLGIWRFPALDLLELLGCGGRSELSQMLHVWYIYHYSPTFGWFSGQKLIKLINISYMRHM